MKEVLVWILTVFWFYSSQAQAIAANDSVSTQQGNTTLVFYNLSTGVKTSASDTIWHLAVTVRPTDYPYNTLGGTTIRMNSGDGVKVFLAPNADTSTFASLDTTGWASWPQLFDSDTSIDNGAFNSIRNPGNEFDYGWGEYNENNHNVIGDSVFLIVLPNGQIKKFIVAGLIFDTAFVLKFSNLDNTALDTAIVSKIQYAGKEFVYLNLETNTIYDLEPASTDWDLEFLHYAVTGVLKGETVIKTGVWVNKGEMVAADAGVGTATDNYSGLNFSSNMDAIGWTWEIFNNNDSTYSVQDSLVYFVETNSQAVYKMVFTAFGGDSTGIISFYQQQLITPSGINKQPEMNMIQAFPNPANNYLHINWPGNESALFKIYDLSGKLLDEVVGTAQFTAINTSNLASGLYLLSAQSNGLNQYARFVVSH